MEVATINFVISRNALFVNTPIHRELPGEETSAAMRSNAEICALSMLRFVHFMWCYLCTLCAVICAEMWGSQEQSAGGFWGGNHHRVRITSAIIILMNHHHYDHGHHHQQGVGRKPAQGTDHFRCRFLAAREFPIPIFKVHHHFPWYFTDYHKMVQYKGIQTIMLKVRHLQQTTKINQSGSHISPRSTAVV